MQQLPDDVATFFALVFFSVLGRLGWVADQVKSGRRTFFSWATLLDMLIAASMGVIAGGAGTWWGLHGWPLYALVSSAGWAGTHLLAQLLARLLLWIDSKIGKPKN